jgi:hypothetical protein
VNVWLKQGAIVIACLGNPPRDASNGNRASTPAWLSNEDLSPVVNPAATGPSSPSVLKASAQPGLSEE